MKEKRKVIYYRNELEDEFSNDTITPKIIDGHYDYRIGKLYLFQHLICYKCVVRPFAFIYLKLKYHHKIVNKKVLKRAKKTGFFLYGNHTNKVADAFIPTLLSYPIDMNVIVHANNVSIPKWGRITPYLGAIPLPDTMEASKNFHKRLKMVIKRREGITIYPEAHIWPYYTKIRPFKSTSFGYPIHFSVPAYCFTNTYQKMRFRKTPRIVTYVRGPFFVNQQLNRKDQKKQLRNEIYQTMVQDSKNNNIEMIQYVKIEGEEQ